MKARLKFRLRCSQSLSPKTAPNSTSATQPQKSTSTVLPQFSTLWKSEMPQNYACSVTQLLRTSETTESPPFPNIYFVNKSDRKSLEHFSFVTN